ncbi:MAG: putative DNA binding domain-containing protein [Thermomicrobiales bacterium]|nr:putative DNA binding domain-containing protein [Thermomicrobiales bacterium]
MAELSNGVKAGAAMMNSAGGGSVYIGVRDDGEIVGIEQGDRSHDRLKREFDKITPSYWPMVETIQLDLGRIVLRITFPGNSGPFRYDDHASIRIGASTHRMPEDQYQRLILERYHTSDRWELKPSQIRTEDLDLKRLVSTVETAISVARLEDPGTRDPQILMQGLGLLSNGGINNAAAVVFGNEDALLGSYPQCKVRLARFEGTTKNQFRDNRQYTGNLFELLRLAQTFVSEHTPIQSRIVADQIQRIDTPRYHPEVVREALVNALVHRDYAEPGGAVDVAIYDDRLVITSTGGLRFGLTVADLMATHQSRPWNQIVANVLQRQGSFESWGRGTLRMIDISRTVGAPDPVFEDDRHSFSVILQRNDVTTNPEMSSREPILAALSEHGSLSISELHSLLSWSGSRRQIQLSLERLRSLGLVEIVGKNRGARWTLSSRSANRDLS